jgi:hypothetical protein
LRLLGALRALHLVYFTHQLDTLRHGAPHRDAFTDQACPKQSD